MRAAGRLHRKCPERDEATSVRTASEGAESDTSIVRSNSGSDRLQRLTRTRSHHGINSDWWGVRRGPRHNTFSKELPPQCASTPRARGPANPTMVPQQRTEPEAQTAEQQFWAEATGRSAQKWGPRWPGPGEGTQAPFRRRSPQASLLSGSLPPGEAPLSLPSPCSVLAPSPPRPRGPQEESGEDVYSGPQGTAV